MSSIGAPLDDHRQQARVSDWRSQSLPVHDGVPQGTRTGPPVFLLTVNNLLESHLRLRCVNHTFTWEHCHVSGSNSDLQNTGNETGEWSRRNGTHLNVDNTKEMMVFFSHKFSIRGLSLFTIAGKGVERNVCAKILHGCYHLQ